MITRSQIQAELTAVQTNPETIAEILANIPFFSDSGRWLGKLKLLYGVPINYLVPDEKMLPKESIRFFYLDINWIDALLDGAFSIGRTLTSDTATPAASISIDTSQMSKLTTTATNNAAAIRSEALGMETSEVSFEVVTGFLIRSSIVRDYKGMGVNAYPLGGTPSDPNTQLLKILRFEQLGPNSDTMLCLVAGDVYQVDLHEAPEALHYGIDTLTPSSATKNIRPFSKDKGSGEVKMDLDPNDLVELDLKANNCFRANAPRTIKMNTLAQLIGDTSSNDPVDAAEMGFEMTEGVGTVSFMLNTINNND